MKTINQRLVVLMTAAEKAFAVVDMDTDTWGRLEKLRTRLDRIWSLARGDEELDLCQAIHHTLITMREAAATRQRLDREWEIERLNSLIMRERRAAFVARSNLNLSGGR